MAIKISGTTVINDSRNIENIGIATATTFSGNITGVAATFTSNIIIGAGSTAAPSITPTGDSNTGIFFPTADTIAIAEGGVEAVRIDSSGRVGIGTNNLTSKLQVQGTIGLGASNDTEIGSPGGRTKLTSSASGFVINHNDNSATIFQNQGTERVRITDAGNIGIGTNNPTSKLDVVGDVRVVGVITATSDVKIGTKSVATTGKAIAMAMVFG